MLADDPLTPAEREARNARLRAQRLAAGLPEFIQSERLHHLIGHVLATHATKAGHGAQPSQADRTRDEQHDHAQRNA